MAKTAKQPNKGQSQRFIDKARELGCDEDPKAFERTFSKIVPPKKPAIPTEAPKPPKGDKAKRARATGRDEDEPAFDERLRKIAKAAPPDRDKPTSGAKKRRAHKIGSVHNCSAWRQVGYRS